MGGVVRRTKPPGRLDDHCLRRVHAYDAHDVLEKKVGYRLTDKKGNLLDVL